MVRISGGSSSTTNHPLARMVSEMMADKLVGNGIDLDAFF